MEFEMVKRFVRFLQGHRTAVIMAVMAMMLTAAMPSFAQSTPVPLNIPVNTIFSETNSWMQTFAPIAAIGIGITVALAVLGYLGKMIAGAFKG